MWEADQQTKANFPLLGPHNIYDPFEQKVSVTDDFTNQSHWQRQQLPSGGSSPTWPPDTPFEKQLLACFWTFLDS